MASKKLENWLISDLKDLHNVKLKKAQGDLLAAAVYLTAQQKTWGRGEESLILHPSSTRIAWQQKAPPTNMYSAWVMVGGSPRAEDSELR